MKIKNTDWKKWISYYSFIILILSEYMYKMICTLGVGIVISLIWYFKRKASDNKSKGWSLYRFEKNIFLKQFLAIGTLAYLFVKFYEKWHTSSMLEEILGGMNIDVDCFLILIDAVLVSLSVDFIKRLFDIIEIKFREFNYMMESNRIFHCILCVLTSLITFVSIQTMVQAGITKMGAVNILMNCLVILIFIAVFIAITGSIKCSIIVNMILFMVLGIGNAYTYSFRNVMLSPLDFNSLGTAMNVADNYSFFPVPTGIIKGLKIIIVSVFLVSILKISKIKKSSRLMMVVVSVLGLIGVGGYTTTITSQHWQNNGARFNGYIIDFMAKFGEMNIDEPREYSLKTIYEVENKYETSENSNSSPHIIVIMDEAFSDLSVINSDLKTNGDVMPYISSLKEDVISGYALASVFGGNTANSEYEFLTSNSMAWFPEGSIPYQQYLMGPSYSMVSCLKFYNENYQCIAMHPYESSGWNRPSVYDNLGFDETIFIEDFPQQDYIRKYISDREMFEKVIDVFEALKDKPLFIFGITMQNHGSYEYKEKDFSNTISIEGVNEDYRDVEQYLSLVHETDNAVEYLIEYFKKVSEDVVIVFFGDHLPGLNESFYTEINDGEYDTLEEIQNRYKVPFFVWANYDIEEQYVDCTSLNYLSNYVYEVANIPMPKYNQFLLELQQVVSAMNSKGYYSTDKDCFMYYEDATQEEKELLNLYEQLQYNSVFDRENRNEGLFPVCDIIHEN